MIQADAMSLKTDTIINSTNISLLRITGFHDAFYYATCIKSLVLKKNINVCQVIHEGFV